MTNRRITDQQLQERAAWAAREIGASFTSAADADNQNYLELYYNGIWILAGVVAGRSTRFDLPASNIGAWRALGEIGSAARAAMAAHAHTATPLAGDPPFAPEFIRSFAHGMLEKYADRKIDENDLTGMFAFVWIELYRKVQEDWRRAGLPFNFHGSTFGENGTPIKPVLDDQQASMLERFTADVIKTLAEINASGALPPDITPVSKMRMALAIVTDRFGFLKSQTREIKALRNVRNFV